MIELDSHFLDKLRTAHPANALHAHATDCPLCALVVEWEQALMNKYHTPVSRAVEGVSLALEQVLPMKTPQDGIHVALAIDDLIRERIFALSADGEKNDRRQ